MNAATRPRVGSSSGLYITAMRLLCWMVLMKSWLAQVAINPRSLKRDPTILSIVHWEQRVLTVMLQTKGQGPAMNNSLRRSLRSVALLLVTNLCVAGIAQNPGSSPHGSLTLECNQCHATESWTPLRSDLQFEHAKTRFPLSGRHTQVTCRQCHSNLRFSESGSECLDCHLDIHQGQFAAVCSNCHTPQGWNDESQMYVFHQQTRFPLTGNHAALDCQACHAEGRYVALPLDCQGCHMQTYQATRNPNHADAGFALHCSECHSLTSPKWKTTFSHTPAFPLTGGHRLDNCGLCHTGDYAATSAECVACHRSRYAATTNPNHVASQFPQECSLCHSTDAWQPAVFDHNLARFPLTGAHVQTACGLCHVNGQYTGTSSFCYDCHRADYETTADPDHSAALFPQRCDECHTTEVWQPSTFDHDNTQYPLTGAHVQADCRQCHLNGQFSGTTTVCYGCHQADYEGVQNPNHWAGQYPQDCTICHNTAAWQPSLFEHNQTNFPLTGAHLLTSCALCHVDGQYAGTPTACFTCHQADYDGVADPNHAANNYPHDCTICHNTAAWDGATFDHNQTDFPLTGAHGSVNCLECHVNGQYAGTPTDCFFCHEADYNRTQNPNHAAAGFPLECAACHTTFNWDAQFNHDGLYFPIYSGRHRDEWNRCGDCHTDPNNYAVFSCIICHEHNCADMLDAHDEVPSFVCESNACYNCHPDGSSDGRIRKIPASVPHSK